MKILRKCKIIFIYVYNEFNRNNDDVCSNANSAHKQTVENLKNIIKNIDSRLNSNRLNALTQNTNHMSNYNAGNTYINNESEVNFNNQQKPSLGGLNSMGLGSLDDLNFNYGLSPSNSKYKNS
jgi:predicted RNA-binding protein